MSDEEWFDYDSDAMCPEYFCRDCGKGGLLCSCNADDDDPRDYNPESDPKRYWQDEGGEG